MCLRQFHVDASLTPPNWNSTVQEKVVRVVGRRKDVFEIAKKALADKDRIVELMLKEKDDLLKEKDHTVKDLRKEKERVLKEKDGVLKEKDDVLKDLLKEKDYRHIAEKRAAILELQLLDLENDRGFLNATEKLESTIPYKVKYRTDSAGKTVQISRSEVWDWLLSRKRNHHLTKDLILARLWPNQKESPPDDVLERAKRMSREDMQDVVADLVLLYDSLSGKIHNYIKFGPKRQLVLLESQVSDKHVCYLQSFANALGWTSLEVVRNSNVEISYEPILEDVEEIVKE
ncbi:hypothetical protein HDU93_004401 [Gonapodya sp. JEL0774]|nr:hypothetical protein HDU93_004401 [Gonapodya sp. JEL0774]